jgi:hypothetical protein
MSGMLNVVAALVVWLIFIGSVPALSPLAFLEFRWLLALNARRVEAVQSVLDVPLAAGIAPVCIGVPNCG